MQMSDQFDEELRKIDEFLDKMYEIADSDGTISRDEQAILDEVMRELSDYRILVFDCAEDGVIDDDELAQMKGFKDRIYNLVNNKALRDGTITDEEANLIDSLFDFVSE